MKSYLVGGAVRDALLGLPVKDKDWVVVGATPEEMLDAGYQQVGRDFPVFLHPKSREEYALARTERKSGSGYTGFTCYAAPDVTLEQDLLRRDLTINALAQDLEKDLRVARGEGIFRLFPDALWGQVFKLARLGHGGHQRHCLIGNTETKMGVTRGKARHAQHAERIFRKRRGDVT